MADKHTALTIAKTLRCLESKDTVGIVISGGLAPAMLATATLNPAIVGSAFLAGITLAGLGRIAYCGHAGWTDESAPLPPQESKPSAPVQARSSVRGL